MTSTVPLQRGLLGDEVAFWIEEALVHSEGDWFGQPFRLTDWQRQLLRDIYRDPRPDRVVVGVPKGNGKSELAAAIALGELVGPAAPTAPVIPVAAASYEQANLVFGAAQKMVAEGPLVHNIDVWDKAIVPKALPGRMYRVAAVAGTNDGQRPTFVVGDELHEWVGNKARVWDVLTQGLAKRRGGWSLGISTAGYNLETLLGRLYRHGQRVLAGELVDDGFLFRWEQAGDGWDLSDPDELRAAIREASPAADSFVDVETVAHRLESGATAEWLFRRYFLNQWTSAENQWLPTGAWRGLERADPPEPGTSIVVSFDGSYNRDATGIVGTTLEPVPRQWVIGLWERPEWEPDWVVPRDEVDARIVEAFDTFDVVELAADPYRWRRELDEWEDRWGERVIEFPTAKWSLMVPACDKFYSAVLNGDLRHDHSPDLARHLSNAVTKETPTGVYITKESKDSPNKIDLAICAVIGYARATWRREQAEDAPRPGITLL